MGNELDKLDIKVMLLSLRPALILAYASGVIIFDPFWNPFIECKRSIKLTAVVSRAALSFIES